MDIIKIFNTSIFLMERHRPFRINKKNFRGEELQQELFLTRL